MNWSAAENLHRDPMTWSPKLIAWCHRRLRPATPQIISLHQQRSGFSAPVVMNKRWPAAGKSLHWQLTLAFRLCEALGQALHMRGLCLVNCVLGDTSCLTQHTSSTAATDVHWHNDVAKHWIFCVFRQTYPESKQSRRGSRTSRLCSARVANKPVGFRWSFQWSWSSV